MPELPEVEITRQRIAPLLVGRKIAALKTTAPSYFFITAPDALRRGLVGKEITGLARRGKYLIGAVSGGQQLLLHLGMTGQLFSSRARSVRLLSSTARASLAPEEQGDFEPDRHTHVQFQFNDDGPEVYFRDVRKFGKILLLAPGERNKRLERLGGDALEITGEHLFAATRKRKTPIKALLLDQSVVAGIGNIYADEALFYSRIRPGRRAASMTKKQCEDIAKEVRRVLERSIATGGSSISDYISPDGSDGKYQDERRVYARTGQACFECETPIRRKLVAQRGTHYCPQCQR